MKTNTVFYNALDWVRVHGVDFYDQFSEDVFNAARYYHQEVDNPLYPRNKREVLKEIREHNEFFFNSKTGQYDYR